MFQPSEVVLLPFPFSDLSSTKLRPVLVVLGPNERGDFLAAQITSQTHHALQEPLSSDDFEQGLLPKASIVRPDKLFSLNQSLVVRRVAKLNPSPSSACSAPSAGIWAVRDKGAAGAGV